MGETFNSDSIRIIVLRREKREGRAILLVAFSCTIDRKQEKEKRLKFVKLSVFELFVLIPSQQTHFSEGSSLSWQICVST